MPAGPPYMPVEARPWRLRMGLRALEPASWLEIDGNRAAELELKHRLLARPETHSRVVATAPGSDAAGAELLDLVLDHLSRHHPGAVTVSGNGVVREQSTGHTVDPRELHPVDAAGRLVQEDLCVMLRRGGEWVLGAASVCFPSRWSLAAKIGRDLSQIHSPVPGYEQELAQPTRAFFDRLGADRPVWRLNWTLLGDPALHQPDSSGRRPLGRDALADPDRQVWFRVERQTLRRISSEAVVFTIRTYVTSLGDLVTRDPSAAAALRVAVDGVPADVLAYKGWEGLAPVVLGWLAHRAATR